MRAYKEGFLYEQLKGAHISRCNNYQERRERVLIDKKGWAKARLLSELMMMGWAAGLLFSKTSPQSNDNLFVILKLDQYLR